MIGCYNGICRPGGFLITNRAMDFCRFRKGDKLLDVGCGQGATVEHIQRVYELEILGIDKTSENLGDSERLKVGDGESLPIGDMELDGILFECSFSKIIQQDRALQEAFRVLKPGGYLILSDFYSKGEPEVLSGLLGRMDHKEELIEKLERNIFQIELFEDYSTEMKTMFGQMLLDYGCEAFYESVGANPGKMKRIKPGYCLIIAKKHNFLNKNRKEDDHGI